MKKLLLFFLFIYSINSFAERKTTENFLFLGGDSRDLSKYNKMIAQNDIYGVQIIYTWKSLEPQKDKYDFSDIERNLSYLNGLHKRLFIQIQDRFFSPDAKHVPDYLMQDPEYAGGIAAQIDRPGENMPVVSGWVAKQWNPAVRHRYQKLLRAIALQFDGKIYGVNIPETSIDMQNSEEKSGFTCDTYFHAELENLMAAKKAFAKSHVVQFVNFFPCEWDDDHLYMSTLFQYAQQNKIGLGGPDVIPYKSSHMHNSYPFFQKFKGRLNLVAMAVQEPDLTYINPKTNAHFTRQEFEDFAANYLGADIIFWTPSLIHSDIDPI